MADEETYAWYVEWWKKALPALLGWSEEEVLTWAREQQPVDRAGYMAAFNYGPAGLIVHLLVSETLKKRLETDTVRELRRKLRFILETQPSERACYTDPSYDWQAARERIAAVLHEYGA